MDDDSRARRLTSAEQSQARQIADWLNILFATLDSIQTSQEAQKSARLPRSGTALEQAEETQGVVVRRLKDLKSEYDSVQTVTKILIKEKATGTASSLYCLLDKLHQVQEKWEAVWLMTRFNFEETNCLLYTDIKVHECEKGLQDRSHSTTDIDTLRKIQRRKMKKDSTHPEYFPESVENIYSIVRSENSLGTKKKIGSKKEKFDYPGWIFNLPEGILQEEKEVTFSARVGIDQKKGRPDITPTFECNPFVTFEKPVSMTMRTCISAPAGKTIPASLLTRDHSGDEWKETQQLSLGQKNEVDFEIYRFGEIKVAAKISDVKLHSIMSFDIHLETGTTAVTFSKDQAVYTTVQEAMHQNGYVNFALIPHEIMANFGSKISISMERKEPKDCTISKAYPSPTFTLDEDYLEMGKRTAYFGLDPEPSDQCRTISMEFGYTVGGELEQHLPLKKKWPRKDTKRENRSDSLVTLNNCNWINANQLAFGAGANMSGAKNTTGDVSTTEVNAPVGQLATGNANITEQGRGNNYVAGSQDNTDRSVTAGKAIYDQSTSSSVGENITVHRTGK